MKMKFYYISTFILIQYVLTITNVSAQTGGMASYQFLSLQPNARIAALGGNAIATYENDVNLAVQNPALLRPSMSQQVGFSHAFYLADIQAGYVTYAQSIDSTQIIGGGLQYVNYGQFQRTGSNGEILGNFNAGDYSLNVTYSKRLDPRLYIGGQVKLLYSSLGEYNSYAIAMDIGLTYHDPIKLWTFSAVVSNIGKELKSYTTNNSEELPFDFQIGASKKLINAPFRFSVIAKHMESPGKMVYQNYNKPSLQKDLETGNVIPENLSFGTKAMSHLNASAELILGKSLYLGMGYNYIRRWEMGLRDFAGMAGFSWGFGIKMSKYQIAYARSCYMIGKSTDHISLIVYLNKAGRS